jgi:hypothetical protein
MVSPRRLIEVKRLQQLQALLTTAPGIIARNATQRTTVGLERAGDGKQRVRGPNHADVAEAGSRGRDIVRRHGITRGLATCR